MTAKPERVVLYTNVFISAIIFRASFPSLALIRAFESGEVLSCTSTRNELREVIRRSKFDRYVPLQQRVQEVEELIEDMVSIRIQEKVKVCDDPKDDKFLELAVNGEADVIVTGDDHLLRLNPFRGIRIVTPLDYLGDALQQPVEGGE